MKLKKAQEKTNNLLIFNKNSLKLLEKDANSLNFNLKYWQKNKSIISLKNGTYVFRANYEQEKDKDSYLEYLANQLLKPSYLSLEYVLAKYQIMTEPVRALSSISLKGARDFKNELGTWRYYNLPKKLFIGFNFKRFRGQDVIIATKAKALFDFLYLRFRRGAIPKIETIEKLRLNLENLNRKEKKEFYSYFNLLPEKRWQTIKKIMEKIC